MDYKIAKLTLKNFKGSSELEVRFGENVNYLIGVNGSGKTMIGTALQYLFEGKTFFNNKYRRKIISGDKMMVSGEFINKETGKTLVISQSLTAKDNPNLKIESKDNLEMSDVMDMINMLYFRPFELIHKSPQEQAEYLGVVTTSHDEKIKAEKKKLTTPRTELNIINAKLKDYPKDGPEKVEFVDLATLYKTREGLQEFNSNQAKAKENITYQKNILLNMNTRIQELELELEKAKSTAKSQQIILDKIVLPLPLKSLTEIGEHIANASEINKKATAYDAWKTLKKELAEKETEFATKKKEVTKAEEDKLTYIKNCKVPGNVSFDEDGGLMLDAFGQKNAYLNESFFSRGQIIKMAIQFCVRKINADKVAGKDTIPVIFVDNAESLDEKMLESIHKIADKHKLQIIFAYQDSKPKKGQACIMLSEKSIGKYKE